MSFTPAISADGRFVAFNSSSTNLVAGGTTGTNGVGNVFVRDRALGTTLLASGNDGGTDTAGGGNSVLSDTIPNWISGDGRYVVFHGYPKLTPNATNDHVHLYRRDLVANKTELVDVNPSGVNANGDGDGGSISADGRFVVVRFVRDRYCRGNRSELRARTLHPRHGAWRDDVDGAHAIDAGILLAVGQRRAR